MVRKSHPIKKRKAARIAAVQALYQLEQTGGDARDIVAEFKNHRLDQLLEPLELTSPAVDADMFQSILLGTGGKFDQIDQLLTPHLGQGWTLQRCGFLLRACLRAAAFELAERMDIPPKVIINEYIQIGEMFIGKGQASVINAVLDGVARAHRPEYFDAAG